ncbi:MAG: hypothetical protein WD766_04845 [Gemmatimonadota bacterium]
MRYAKDNAPRAAKPGEKTGTKCPLCNEAVLRQEQISSNGTYHGSKLVCSKRGCPWQGKDD